MKIDYNNIHDVDMSIVLGIPLNLLSKKNDHRYKVYIRDMIIEEIEAEKISYPLYSHDESDVDRGFIFLAKSKYDYSDRYFDSPYHPFWGKIRFLEQSIWLWVKYIGPCLDDPIYNTKIRGELDGWSIDYDLLVESMQRKRKNKINIFQMGSGPITNRFDILDL